MKTHTQLYSPKLKNEIQLKEEVRIKRKHTILLSTFHLKQMICFFYVAGHLNVHNDITLYEDHTWMTALAHTLFSPYIGCTLCRPPLNFFFDRKHLM